jgi:hypothetical protein
METVSVVRTALPGTYGNRSMRVTGRKILVIDDHYEVQDFLRSMLELASDAYAVHCVPRLRKAGWSCCRSVLTC